MQLTHGLSSDAYLRAAERCARAPRGGLAIADDAIEDDHPDEPMFALEDEAAGAPAGVEGDVAAEGDAGHPVAAAAAAGAVGAHDEAGGAVGAQQEEDPPAPGTMAEADQKRRLQSLYRQTVSDWCIGGGVAGDCAAMYRAIDNHRDMIARQLFVSGDQWERKQRILERDALQAPAGSRSVEDAPLRTFRMGRAYSCIDEIRLIGKAEGDMRSIELWECLPEADRTEARHTEIYKMLARTCARAHMSKLAHRNYPYRVFGILENHGLAPEVRVDCKCPRRVDQWGMSFVEHYADLCSPDAIADLRATALLAREETVHIEKQHSWLRRFVFQGAHHPVFLMLVD